MGLRFGPEQEDEFEAASDDLVRRFESATAGDQGWAAQDVMGYKWRYLHGDLTTWSVDDVETLLFDIYPGKVNLPSEGTSDFIAGFAAFLRFLSDERLLSEGTGDRLARRVEGAQAEFEAAMNDRERFSPGKRLLVEMIADGIDPTNQEAMNEWVSGFNNRSFEERDRVLGPSLERARRSVDEGAERTRLLPVVLVPEAEAREAARVALVSRQMRDLVSFMASGRKLTDKGNLTVADGRTLVTFLGTNDLSDWPSNGEGSLRVRSSTDLREVDLLFRIALAADFLEKPSARSVRVGPAAGLLESDPLEAAGRLLEATLSQVGLVAHDRGGDHYGFGWFADEVDDQVTRLLLDLSTEKEPLSIEEFTDECWEDLNELYDLEDIEDYKLELHQDLVQYSARRALHQLTMFGVVEQSGIRSYLGEFRTKEERGGTVALTPLGKWLVHRMLASVADVPVAGALVEVPADELLTRAADLPDDVAQVELEVWLEAHGDGGAALLVEALAGADETGRLIAFRALWDVGPAAAEAMALLSADPELSAYALIWRVQTGLGAKEELDAGGDPERLIRILGTMLVIWGPEVMVSWVETVAGAAGSPAVMEKTWSVRLPETEAVLSAVGSFHPHKAVAKAARRSLFKFRTSGGLS